MLLLLYAYQLQMQLLMFLSYYRQIAVWLHVYGYLNRIDANAWSQLRRTRLYTLEQSMAAWP